MWKKVLTPTLLVISIWIGLGCVTTFYIQWQSELRARLLQENVATIQAVAEMQNALLRLQALTASAVPSPDVAGRAELQFTAFTGALASADRTIGTAQEEAVASLLRQRYSEYRVAFRDWTQAGDLAGRPAATPAPHAVPDAQPLIFCLFRLLAIDKDLLVQSEAASQSYHWFRPFRLMVMVLGPALGIACGVWIARGFRHSIARISVSLSSTESGVSQPVGLVCVIR
jgi:hypothetical protein